MASQPSRRAATAPPLGRRLLDLVDGAVHPVPGDPSGELGCDPAVGRHEIALRHLGGADVGDQPVAVEHHWPVAAVAVEELAGAGRIVVEQDAHQHCAAGAGVRLVEGVEPRGARSGTARTRWRRSSPPPSGPADRRCRSCRRRGSRPPVGAPPCRSAASRRRSSGRVARTATKIASTATTAETINPVRRRAVPRRRRRRDRAARPCATGTVTWSPPPAPRRSYPLGHPRWRAPGWALRPPMRWLRHGAVGCDGGRGTASTVPTSITAPPIQSHSTSGCTTTRRTMRPPLSSSGTCSSARDRRRAPARWRPQAFPPPSRPRRSG